MCSDSTDSILSHKSVSELKDFTLSKLLSELENYAPTFLMILRECTRTRRPRYNRGAVIGTCAALINLRFSKMNLVQKIMSLSGGSSHGSKGSMEHPFPEIHQLTQHHSRTRKNSGRRPTICLITLAQSPLRSYSAQNCNFSTLATFQCFNI